MVVGHDLFFFWTDGGMSLDSVKRSAKSGVAPSVPGSPE